MNLRIPASSLIRGVSKYVAPSSFSAIAALSVFSLAGFVFNYKYGFNETARNSYQWVVYLQAIAGFVPTFFSASFHKENINNMSSSARLVLINLCLIAFLLSLLVGTQYYGLITASIFIGVTNSLYILEGSRFLQLPIYILLSLGTSFQLFLSPIAHSLECVRISEASVLVLYLCNIKKLKINPFELVRTVIYLPLPMLLRSLVLGCISAFNAILPVLYLGTGQISKILNIMLRATFTIETIFLSRIQHSGRIHIAYEMQASRAYPLMCLSLLVVNILISISIYLLGGFASVEYGWPWGIGSLYFYLIFISSLVGASRLLYAFTYYKAIHSTYAASSVSFNDPSEVYFPRIISSIIFLLLIFSALFASIWLHGFVLLLVPPILFIFATIYLGCI